MHKSTREQKKGKRQHNKNRLLESASKLEAGELEELRLKSRHVTSSISTHPHSKKETGTEIIIGTLSVRYLRTVERESEPDKALDEKKFDITELSKVRKFGETIIQKPMAIYLITSAVQKAKWKCDFW